MSKPLRFRNRAAEQKVIDTANAQMESMFGDLREAKGRAPISAPSYLPKKRVPRGAGSGAHDIDAVNRKQSKTPERKVNEEIRDTAKELRHVKLWRNNRGQVQLPNGGALRYGVGPNGASDWIGFRTVEITADMVGQHFAQFVAVESKAPKKNATQEQSDFIDTVLEAGGIAGVAHSGCELRGILK